MNDEEDKCINEAGSATNNGCPVITEAKKTRMSLNANMIFFDLGSAAITKNSFTALNDVVAFLNEKENTSLKLDIEGHGDNVGGVAINLKVSQSRADAILNYLKKKGIAANRLTAKGYGLSKPLVDNSTPQNRAKNRRVEMNLREN